SPRRLLQAGRTRSKRRRRPQGPPRRCPRHLPCQRLHRRARRPGRAPRRPQGPHAPPRRPRRTGPILRRPNPETASPPSKIESSPMQHRTSIPFVIAAVLVVAPTRAQEIDRAASTMLFKEAREAMRQGDYAAAYPKLNESFRLNPAAGTLINLAD